jgi:hypothetical protein
MDNHKEGVHAGGGRAAPAEISDEMLEENTVAVH